MFKFKNNVKLYIFSFIICVLIGVILHFAYDKTNCFFIGLFTPVNESIWEHLKLSTVPLTLFGFYYNHKCKNINKNSVINIWYHMSISIILSLIIIPTSYYLYKTRFITVPDFVNIIIYIISMALSFLYLFFSLQNKTDNIVNKNNLGILIIILIYILFIIFTIYPLHLEIFRDPITNTYGL